MNSILYPLINTFGFTAYVFAAAYLLLSLMLAVAVFRDAHFRGLTGKGTFLVGPAAWSFIIVMTGGPTGAFAYWLVHYSSLRYVPKE